MVKEIQTKDNKKITVDETDASEHVKRVWKFYGQFHVLETHGPSGRALTSASSVSCLCAL